MGKVIRSVLVGFTLIATFAAIPAVADTPVARKRPAQAFPALRAELTPGRHVFSFHCATESEEKRGLAVVAGSFEPVASRGTTRWTYEVPWDADDSVRGRLPGTNSPVEVDLTWGEHSLLLGMQGEISIDAGEGGTLRWFCAQSGTTTWLADSFSIDGAAIDTEFQPLESFQALRLADFRGVSAEGDLGVGALGTYRREFWGYAIGRFGGTSGAWSITTPTSSKRVRDGVIEFSEHTPGQWTFSYRGAVTEGADVLWLAELRFLECKEGESSTADSSDRTVKAIACSYVA